MIKILFLLIIFPFSLFANSPTPTPKHVVHHHKKTTPVKKDDGKFHEETFPKEILYPIHKLYQSYKNRNFQGMFDLSNGKFLNYMGVIEDSMSQDLSSTPPIIKNFILNLKDMKIINAFTKDNQAVVTVFWILEESDIRQLSGHYTKIQEVNYLLEKKPNVRWKIIDTKQVTEYTLYDKRKIPSNEND